MIILKHDAQFTVYEGQVNYIVSSMEQAVGKLQITEESIKFVSYKVTMIQESFEIRRTDIKKVEKKKTMYIMRNNLKIYLKSGKDYTISTWEQEKIYNLLTKDDKGKEQLKACQES
ncbi:conserved protein of unknown function [Paenibacillus alvei]|uniref:Uncharacterized protein n=1 Tax=Paenibacillus alvei TaxID=44250 RepID=A0A383R8U0_PAEAL|nr:conserved protein of unknown function [Paenibacillus alvei]